LRVTAPARERSQPDGWARRYRARAQRDGFDRTRRVCVPVATFVLAMKRREEALRLTRRFTSADRHRQLE
jgi:hypothetical protein